MAQRALFALAERYRRSRPRFVCIGESTPCAVPIGLATPCFVLYGHLKSRDDEEAVEHGQCSVHARQPERRSAQPGQDDHVGEGRSLRMTIAGIFFSRENCGRECSLILPGSQLRHEAEQTGQLQEVEQCIPEASKTHDAGALTPQHVCPLHA